MCELSDTRIKKKTQLPPPFLVKAKYPISDLAKATVLKGRKEVEAILEGRDKRLLVIVGPCSIHDEISAFEYAKRLQPLRLKYQDKLCIIMRVYFEKPRTSIGWKGLINQPSIVGEPNINLGRKLSRKILLKINEIGLPVATEILDPSTPQIISDLISWGAIGARTTESQTHREMASGLSFPVGFKNGTDGDCKIAIKAMLSAKESHSFVGVDEISGSQSEFVSTGNPFTQLILRGGSKGSNYDFNQVYSARYDLEMNQLSTNIIVDCSHANCDGDYKKQAQVLSKVLRERIDELYSVTGVMIESHLNEGRQEPDFLDKLKYGVSITDACVGWEETERMLTEAYKLC